MDVYAVTLAIAVGFCVLAAIALGIAKWKRNEKASRVCKVSSAAAIAFDIVSFAVHRFYDHAAGSPEALNGLEFLKQHPAFLIVGVLSVVFLIVVARTSRQHH